MVVCWKVRCGRRERVLECAEWVLLECRAVFGVVMLDVGSVRQERGMGRRRGDGREGAKVRVVRKERRVLDGERCRGIVGW